MPPHLAQRIPTGDGRLWPIINRVWFHIFNKYGRGNQFDWFYKADTDTFVLVDNFKAFVHQMVLNMGDGGRGGGSRPLYVGHTVFHGIPEGGHNLGGAGYAVNSAALRKMSPELPAHPQWTPARGERGFA